MCLTQQPSTMPAGQPSASWLIPALRSAAQRACATAHLPLWHEAYALTKMAEIRRHELWGSPPVDARGLPVVLVGGLGGSARLLAPLRELLTRYNCRCVVAPTGLGIDCGEAATQVVEDTVVRLREETGRRVLIIAHSRGGQFARATAVRRSGDVAGLVTLGSPLVQLLAVTPVVRVLVGMLGTGGMLGIPGLMRPMCLWGKCCRKLRTDIAGPFPGGVAFSSIFSRSDAVVSWRSCLDPAARHVPVECTHGGLLWCPRSLHAITAELMSMLRMPQRRPLATPSRRLGKGPVRPPKTAAYDVA